MRADEEAHGDLKRRLSREGWFVSRQDRPGAVNLIAISRRMLIRVAGHNLDHAWSKLAAAFERHKSG